MSLLSQVEEIYDNKLCVQFSYIIIYQKSTISHQSMAQQQSQMEMEISNLISQLYEITLSEEIEPAEKQSLINTKIQPNADKKCSLIAQKLRNTLNKINGENINSEEIREIVVVSNRIVVDTPHYKGFQNIREKQLNGLVLYIQKQTNVFALDSCIIFIDKMFLDYGDQVIFSNCEPLFKALLKRFMDFSTDQIRQIAVEVLVEMMLDNIKLVKYANMPYSFLQFWLYIMNSETQLDRQLYWIECVKKLYGKDKTVEDTLFYDNDFKIFIDLLARVISHCANAQSLKMLLECYLVLTCTKKMSSKLLRIDDIKEYVSHIKDQNSELTYLIKQIEQLK